jgi:hypothetical protein
MKKEQEEETAKRVALERSKRAGQEKKPNINSVNQDTSQIVDLLPNEHDKVQESSIVPIDPVTPVETNVSIERQIECQTSTDNTNEPDKFIGDINVSSILRQQRISSSSSTNDDEIKDDEW